MPRTRGRSLLKELAMVDAVRPTSSAEIDSAASRLAPLGLTSPLVHSAIGPSGKRVHFKLENLQPVGCFKIRPIGNAILTKSPSQLQAGVYTASSGNSAVAVAWMARRLGISATAIVPPNAPAAKLEKLRHLGARVHTVPYNDWWKVIEDGTSATHDGLFIDAVRDPAALAGNATIGREIIRELPDVEAIFVPLGGGGLACGIACAIRERAPHVRIIVCELDTAHPAKAAFAAGHPVRTPAESFFVTGVGYETLLPEMWPMISRLVDEVITVSIAEVAAAIRLLAEQHHVVAEGAGAIPIAAALSGRYAATRVCCVVSGGNIDNSVLTDILMNPAASRSD